MWIQDEQGEEGKKDEMHIKGADVEKRVESRKRKMKEWKNHI